MVLCYNRHRRTSAFRLDLPSALVDCMLVDVESEKCCHPGVLDTGGIACERSRPLNQAGTSKKGEKMITYN